MNKLFIGLQKAFCLSKQTKKRGFHHLKSMKRVDNVIMKKPFSEKLEKKMLSNEFLVENIKLVTLKRKSLGNEFKNCIIKI